MNGKTAKFIVLTGISFGAAMLCGTLIAVLGVPYAVPASLGAFFGSLIGHYLMMRK